MGTKEFYPNYIDEYHCYKCGTLLKNLFKHTSFDYTCQLFCITLEEADLPAETLCDWCLYDLLCEYNKEEEWVYYSDDSFFYSDEEAEAYYKENDYERWKRLWGNKEIEND